MNNLEQALKQQPSDEPVAWLTDRDVMYFDKEDAWRDCDGFIRPLYTRPQPAREWVGLTHDEVNSWELPDCPTVFEFAQFIEAKLKEKNHG
jgi:hypothetical protein